MKTEVKHTENRGYGLFATELIKTGELIFDWSDGISYEADKASNLPFDVKDYAIQYASDKWMDTTNEGRWSNHSCSPNSGIFGKFQLRALRDIKRGEEIVWDYDTTENSDWEMKDCKCGSDRCRKWIHGYRYLPDEIKKEYWLHTADWIRIEEIKARGFDNIFVYDAEPEELDEEHSHDYDTKLFILSGRINITSPQSGMAMNIQYKAGDEVLIPRHLPHTAKVKEEGCRYIVAEKH